MRSFVQTNVFIQIIYWKFLMFFYSIFHWIETRLTWRREDNKPIETGNWQIKKESGFEYRKCGKRKDCFMAVDDYD